MKQRELGIYIHIPFCKSKCYYCDFISYTNRNSQVEQYMQEVRKEMEQYDISDFNVTTIYIGGGTPSFIDEKYIQQLLEAWREKLKNNETKFEEMEITIEINPGTITKQKLEQYKRSGVNRISMGLQSTNDSLLQQIGRIHNYQEFLHAYELVRETGFDNINLDIMIGLPNQTIQDVKKTLAEIQRLNPSHVSVYSLMVEEHTKMEQLIATGELDLPEEEQERQMYWYVKNTLELNGYRHYEISNFAKPGKESKHNLNCWEQKEYIGLGAAAHSYLNGVRFANVTFTEMGSWDYTAKQVLEKQSLEDKRKEFMLLGLRKIQGVRIQKFKEKFVDNPIFLFREEIEKLVREQLLVVDGDWIRLTSLGIDLANLVWQEFV